MDDIKILWFKFNEYSNKLALALGRTSNIVGEYAEYIAHQYYGGSLLPASAVSADIKTSNGNLLQIKSRKIKKSGTTQLGVIRSWNFDFLIVILFDENGKIIKAIEVPVEIAQIYAVPNKHQNGWIISTTKNFICDDRVKDISKFL